MTTIALKKILNLSSQKKFTYKEDSFFIEKKHFLLESLYSLTLSYESITYENFDNKNPSLFSDDGDEQQAYQAMILKLDGQYYLTSIDGCDGYRDDRGSIYPIDFHEAKLLTFLEENSIINPLPFPIEIKIVEDFREEHEGIVIIIGDYAEKEENMLVQLTTDNSDSYYPSGHIYFDSSVLNNAKEYLESKHLEASLLEAKSGAQKIKI